MNPTYEHHRPYDGCDLYRGDALDVLPLLAEEGITADMVLSDPPYGTTHCRWDAVIDIPGMWNAVQGISRPDTPVLLFCQHPFTSLLGSSNLRRLRYAWVWEKTQATGFLNARRMPMKAHEDILVFYDRLPKYHPIKTDKQLSCLHATQKPVALLEYLIRTYTDEGDIVLDFAMGSGSTAVACRNTGRRFIGVEIDLGIFQTALNRITHG